MQARDIMTRSVFTVRTSDPIRQAADLIRDRMPHDPRSHLRPLPPEQPDPATRVREVMSDAVICLGSSADTADLAALMLDNNLQAVPIVDGAHLVGIVSRRDLLRTLLRDDAMIGSEVSQRLEEYAGDPGRWDVRVGAGVVNILGELNDESERKIVTPVIAPAGMTMSAPYAASTMTRPTAWSAAPRWTVPAGAGRCCVGSV